MSGVRSKKIYCVYCGEKNNIIDTNCKKCNKKLNPKEHLFREYIIDHIKDDLKGKTQDKIFSIIKNFIISHLYGSIFTATLIFTIVSNIIVDINDSNRIKEVTSKPTMMVGNVNKCNFENIKEQELVCNEGYTLYNDICIKEEVVDAISNRVCKDNYYLSGSRCVSNKTYEKIIEKECIAPEGDNYLNTIVENDTCLVNVCAGWTDGECSAGGYEEIDFTITQYCPDGTSLINGECKKTTNFEIEYECEEGTLEESICLIKKEEKPKLSCREGYTFNDECNICVGE